MSVECGYLSIIRTAYSFDKAPKLIGNLPPAFLREYTSGFELESSEKSEGISARNGGKRIRCEICEVELGGRDPRVVQCFHLTP